MTYLYKPEEKVHDLFVHNPNISFVTFEDIEYSRETMFNLKLKNPFTEAERDRSISYLGINPNCFVEKITKEDLYKDRVKSFMIDYNNMVSLTISPICAIIKSINGEKIFYGKESVVGVDSRAAYGVNNNLEAYLMSRRNYFNDFDYTFEIVHNWDNVFENVHKYYYFKNDMIEGQNTGAGSVTGWITFDELSSIIGKDYLQYNVINLQTSFRLKKDI